MMNEKIKSTTTETQEPKEDQPGAGKKKKTGAKEIRGSTSRSKKNKPKAKTNPERVYRNKIIEEL